MNEQTMQVKWSIGRRLLIAAAIVYSLILAYIVAAHISNPLYKVISDYSQFIAPFFASICCFYCARFGRHKTRNQRWGWINIAVGCGFWAYGQAVFTYYELIRKVDNPFPGLADFGYLAGYPFIIYGVIALSGSTSFVEKIRHFLDCAIATASISFLSWHFLIERLWQESKAGYIDRILTVAYPLADVAALFATVVLITGRVSTSELKRSSYLLAAGICLVAATDSIWTYYTLMKIYHTGTWFDPGWSFGFTLVGFSALSCVWWSGSIKKAGYQNAAGHQSKKLSYILGPYLISILAFSIVVQHDYQHDNAVDISTVSAGILLITLVSLRQVFSIYENMRLSDRLKTFNANLETIVKRRTRELISLRDLTKAVNSALSIDKVILAALNSTKDALEADAVLIWMNLCTNEMESHHNMELYAHVGLEDIPEFEQILSSQIYHDQVEMFPVITEDGDYGPVGICLKAPIRWQQKPQGIIGIIRLRSNISPVDSDLLESIGIEVGSALENARLFDAAKAAADRDSVTGLFNHRAVHQRLRVEFQKAAANGSSLSIIMMDLNNFKLFNDTYGHPVGDDVLKRVAVALSDHSRAGDILGRYGGDEFILVLPNTDNDQAVDIATNISRCMEVVGYRRSKEEHIVPVTLSYGVATYPRDASTRHELMTIADNSLYAAKNSDQGISVMDDRRRALRAICRDSSFDFLDALVTAVDNKDRYTGHHSEDVTEYALWIAEALGLSEETMRVIRIGALLHDVGKIGVPDEILRKPGRLSDEEYEIMKRHVRIGALMVNAVPGMEEILDAVAAHHERWDGKGYPDNLNGDQIPLLGRILAVGDAFSAMTTDRPYRKGLSWDVALEEIRANAGTQFDPEIAHAFLRIAKVNMPFRFTPAPAPEQSNESASIL